MYMAISFLLFVVAIGFFIAYVITLQTPFGIVAIFIMVMSVWFLQMSHNELTTFEDEDE